MTEDQWAVSVAAGGVQATPGPDNRDNAEWPLLSKVRGVLPNGTVVSPRVVGQGQLSFDPELPPGSKVTAGELQLAEISALPPESFQGSPG